MFPDAEPSSTVRATVTPASLMRADNVGIRVTRGQYQIGISRQDVFPRRTQRSANLMPGQPHWNKLGHP